MRFHNPTAALLWILACAYLNCAGWSLSALQQFTGDYTTVLAVEPSDSSIVAWGDETWCLLHIERP
jgi:hypothetical protein